MGQQDRLMYPLEQQTTLRTGKIPSRWSSTIPTLSLQKFPTLRSSLWAPSTPLHACRVQAETHKGTANLLATKILNKYNNKKLYLTTGPQRTKRHRTNACACVKHSMLRFTRISVNKSNSSYNSIDKKLTLEQYSADISQIVNKIYLIQAAVKNITIT